MLRQQAVADAPELRELPREDGHGEEEEGVCIGFRGRGSGDKGVETVSAVLLVLRERQRAVVAAEGPDVSCDAEEEDTHVRAADDEELLGKKRGEGGVV